MRTTLFAVLLALSGCGTFCDGVVAAEQGANTKAQNCNLQKLDVHDSNKCNAGLSKCSADDMSALKNYANCLNGLEVCTSENEVQFNFARAGCTTQAVSKVSFTCLGSIL
ncbi:MAG: hypothetical protein IPJ65_34145 [Archangiaceae bacterium]|nr:hypothetical protein [Archangiaceae bacterium]